MPYKYFVTGTDTEIGKTYTSIGLLKAFKQRDLKTIGLKPIASGCIIKNHKLYNEDALSLQKAASIPLDYDLVNPYAFELAIAPNIAALRLKQSLNVFSISQKLQNAFEIPADIYLLEGAGGWHVPLNDKETMAHLVKHLELKVILVVGIRLGCINHALLTYEAIKQENLKIAGWVANCILPLYTETDEVIRTLKNWLKAPLLGIIGYQKKAEEVLDVGLLE